MSVRVRGLEKVYRVRKLSAPIYDNVNQPLTLLYLKILCRLQRGEETIYALKNVSFEVGRGCLMAVLGPNGSGKTTLLRILAGLTYPTRGEAYIEDIDILRDRGRLKKAVMYIPGLIAVDLLAESNLTVKDNLVKYAKLLGASRDRVDEVLSLCGLAEYEDRLLYELSTGILSRLSFAFGILKEALVYLMDEPFTGISFEVKNSLIRLVREVLVRRLGSTVLYATHILGDAENLCEDFIFLKNGEIVARGSVRELVRRLRLKEKVEIEVRTGRGALTRLLESLGIREFNVEPGERGFKTSFLVEDSREFLPVFVEKLLGIGGKLLHVRVGEPSLEEVYTRVVGREVWEKPYMRGGGYVCPQVF